MREDAISDDMLTEITAQVTLRWVGQRAERRRIRGLGRLLVDFFLTKPAIFFAKLQTDFIVHFFFPRIVFVANHMRNQLCCNENLYSTLLDLIESMGF